MNHSDVIGEILFLMSHDCTSVMRVVINLFVTVIYHCDGQTTTGDQSHG